MFDYFSFGRNESGISINLKSIPNEQYWARVIEFRSGLGSLQGEPQHNSLQRSSSLFYERRNFFRERAAQCYGSFTILVFLELTVVYNNWVKNKDHNVIVKNPRNLFIESSIPSIIRGAFVLTERYEQVSSNEDDWAKPVGIPISCMSSLFARLIWRSAGAHSCPRQNSWQDLTSEAVILILAVTRDII